MSTAALTRRRAITWSAPAVATLVLAVIGVGISIYLTYEHFTGAKSFACPANAAINCEKVTTSRWSEFLGMPVAVLGLAYFVGMTVLCLPMFTNRWVNHLRVLGAVVGILMALWLIYVELFLVEAICLWCTGIHVVTVALLGTVVWRRQRETELV